MNYIKYLKDAEKIFFHYKISGVNECVFDRQEDVGSNDRLPHSENNSKEVSCTISLVSEDDSNKGSV